MQRTENPQNLVRVQGEPPLKRNYLWRKKQLIVAVDVIIQLAKEEINKLEDIAKFIRILLKVDFIENI